MQLHVVSRLSLSLFSCKSMSSALSCFRKPWFGRIQRCCLTCSMASTTVKLCFIIRYAKTKVADLLRPIKQCTNTLAGTQHKQIKSELQKNKCNFQNDLYF